MSETPGTDDDDDPGGDDEVDPTLLENVFDELAKLLAKNPWWHTTARKK